MLKQTAIATALTLALTSCATDQGMNRAQTGAVLGAVLGAAVGNQTGDNSKDRRRERVIGAVLGAAAGAGIGAHMDKQEAEFREALATEQANHQIEIKRVTEEVLQLTLDSEVSFDVNSAAVKPTFDPSLRKLSDVLIRYPDTAITIVGHTDSSGSDAYNQRLSVQRAQSVVDRLRAMGVQRGRMTAEGRGESEPRDSNATAEGRARNRRVEVFVAAQG